MKYRDIKSKIIKSASQSKIPVLCEFELTSNCNFSCPMCYVHSFEQALSTAAWTSIFDAAIDAGLIFANLTGGEIFLRDDFNYLYEYLFDRGIKITLFTNGSILKKDTLTLLKVKKPHFIAITLYGYDELSYKNFTGNKDSFKNVLANIKTFKDNNINVILRTIPILEIYNNLDQMINLAKSLNEKLYYNKYITKFNIKNTNNFRLNPKQLLDFSIKLNTAFNFKREESKLEDAYLSCPALKGSAYINHLGEMLPCAYATSPKESIQNKDFYQTFLKLGKTLEMLEAKNPCDKCEYVNECLTCYARRASEAGINKCSKYLKKIAKEEVKYYNICGITYYIDYQFQGYLNHNIEKYRTKTIQNPIYKIRTHIVDELVLPDKKPSIEFSTRKIYVNSETESIFSVDTDNNIKYCFKRNNLLNEFDLYINQNHVKKPNELEYILMGIAFLYVCISNLQIPLHGSAISYKGESIIFSAPSKTGKSTLSNNFIKTYKGFEIFNDDKPIIYLKDNQIVTAGTPFCGKDTINKNEIYPLKAIFFLEQSELDEIIEIDDLEKLSLFLKNTFRPKEKELWSNISEVSNTIINGVDIYKARVTNTLNAPKLIYNFIYGGKDNES